MVKRSLSAPLLLLVAMPALPASASELPPGFQESVYVSDLVEPTAMAWGPSGELWIAGKRGHVWVYRAGGARSLVAELPVASKGEEGIEGIAVDPDYATNQLVWIYYTRSEPKPVRNVLSRFRHVGDQLVEETVILNGPQVTDEVHNGGCLRFADDKSLFVSVGDDNQPDRAQDKTNLRGKILHLDHDGSPAADNPFKAGGGNPYVWAYGFRNPWRFDIQPGTGALFVGDVGKDRWEEVDSAFPGGDFGWPVVEGPEPGGVKGMVYPIHAYPHEAGQGASITGGDHVRGSSFPPEYRGNYFFGDSTRGWIRRMVLDASNGVVSVEAWATKLARVVDIQFGPTGALYYLGYDTGKVVEVTYVGGNNRQPVAVATATPDEGNAPLRVSLDASASSDADGDPLSYLWDFGDGTSGPTPTATHTYPRGAYTARLTVNDGRGGEGRSGGIRIVSGNNRPSAEITAPANEARYHVGDRIGYSGRGVDPEEGTIPCSQMSWTVVLHHNDHTHPFLGPLQGSCSGSFVTVDHGDTGVYFEIRLTVSDKGGSLGAVGILAGTQSVVVRPVAASAARRLRP